MTALPRNHIILGDALTRLRALPDAEVDAVITSPPYFRLRDYQVDGQLGLEDHVNQWVVDILAITQELGRVLVPTGTLWLNVGDSYATHPREGAPAKSLLGGPERLLLGLIEQGWRVRNKIVWAKTNPMPTSVTDRLATTYEVIYLLSKQRDYFFDLDAIREEHTSERRGVGRRPGRQAAAARQSARGTTRGGPSSRPRQPSRGSQGPATRPRPSHLGPNADGDSGLIRMKREGIAGHPLGKNPGDVWRFPSSAFRGAHFATYPEVLVERMVRAGVPEQRCTACLAPYRRPVRRLGRTAVRLALRPDCDCAATSEPGLVLDPFMGAGTTAVVAEREGRDWLGIELNPDFIQLANERIQAARARGDP